MSLIEHWPQAMCPEHNAKLTMSNQGGWMCSSAVCHIVREPIWTDVVPADDLRRAVEALREAGALAANVRVGWGKTLPRDVKDCLRRIEDLARLGGR